MVLMQNYLNREQVKEIIPMADFSENVDFQFLEDLCSQVLEQQDMML